MLRLLNIAVVGFAMILPTIAFACPAVEEDGYDVTYTGDDLYRERGVNVVAGGSDIDGCRILTIDGERVTGYFADSPDVELHYSDDGNYKLRIWAEGDCDTKILVNTGAGNWFYDDDSGPDQDGRVTITNPSDGTYDIWVGTYSSGNCDSTLWMETFDD